MNAFKHNLKATEVGLTWGKSFLFGSAISELANHKDAMIGDSFINKALSTPLLPKSATMKSDCSRAPAPEIRVPIPD